MIADDFLVIGRQVRTDYDGYIDLLCLDSRGDTVIIELKRGRTPREVTAQSLDYASWVKELSRETIIINGSA
jgi:RecB family endonuclease NucS